MKSSAIWAAAILLSVSGCMSMGTNFDPAAVAQLQPGMTRDEVIRRLGKPNSMAMLANGTQRLMWVHSKGSMFGAQARSLLLEFTPDGKLIQTVGQGATNLK